MPFFRKHNPSSQSPSKDEGDSGRRSYFSRKTFSSATTYTNQSTKTPQASLAPAFSSPSNLHPRPTSTGASETQFLWEDINPPAEYLSQVQAPPSYPYNHSLPPSHISTRTEAEETHTSPYPSARMLNQSQPGLPSVPSNSALPGYNDVSGAVVVDADGYPCFLSPQEELDRKAELQRAVQERMMGLPRTTNFSWQASGSPVLPRYECVPSGEKRISSSGR
ncbi:hypothetical protein ASPCAL05599 [Aspergillus calidoustus]|uniref:Uncharacterized protein n=1 Tax=Aspergillus calidoustus TaxID=454130 RepID=A0A0U5FYP1_ASPCI|nr:hypothetical protein ASPCAL05599 [Aspergillus calidoustus]